MAGGVFGTRSQQGDYQFYAAVAAVEVIIQHMVLEAMSKGRGGYPNRRKTGTRNARWATDVAQIGHPIERNRDGRIYGFYRDRAAADKAAAGWNARAGHHAIVVPAWYEDEGASPWETTEGRDEMDEAYRAAGVRRPDWLQQLYDGDSVIGGIGQTPVGVPTDGGFPSEPKIAAVPEPEAVNRESADPEPAEILSVDPQDALMLLRDMVAAIANSDRTVEQLVVLLWALGRARAFQPRLARYGDVREELNGVLQELTAESDPVQVWLELAEWSQWWQIEVPSLADRLGDLNLQAGLALSIYELAALDSEWTARAAQVLRDAIGSSPELSDVLVTVGLAAPPDTAAPSDAQPRKIPVEQHITEQYSVEYDALAATTRLRREGMLQNRYVQHLRALGHEVCSYEIPIDGQKFRADIYDETAEELIEVKSSIDRVTMRLALGQILDYARVLQPTVCTVLVPEQPADGLVALFNDHGVQIVWAMPTGEFRCRQEKK